MKKDKQFTINEHEACEVVYLIRAVKAYIKDRNSPIYMLEYLKKREVLDSEYKFNKGSLKYLSNIEKKFADLFERATGEKLR